MGISIFEKSAPNSGAFPGDVAFKLYDTFGFPIDLTELMAKEKGLSLDKPGFEKCMEDAKHLARSSWKGKGHNTGSEHLVALGNQKTSDFQPGEVQSSLEQVQTGPLQGQGKVLGLANGDNEVKVLAEGERGFVILDSTCFYAESGGQSGDQGQIQGPKGHATVENCTKSGNSHLLHIVVTKGAFHLGDVCQQTVDKDHRQNLARNHTATHLLHQALKDILGNHVSQAGSLVEAERLRFDFTHPQPLSQKELEKIEKAVNTQIEACLFAKTETMPLKQALKSGVEALFGEKYNENAVRVVTHGDYSRELCGGTHLTNTGFIGLFKIVSETGVKAGVRRLEALTGPQARQFAQKHILENQQARDFSNLPTHWSQYLNEPLKSTSEVIEELQKHIQSFKKELGQLKKNQIDIPSLVKSAQKLKDSSVLIMELIPTSEQDILLSVSDQLQSQLEQKEKRGGIVILVGLEANKDRYPIVVSVSKNLEKSFPAGKVLKSLAQHLGGSGGGKPSLARGSVTDLSTWENSKKSLPKELV